MILWGGLNCRVLEGQHPASLATSEESLVPDLSWLLCFPVCKAVPCCIQMKTVTKEEMLTAKRAQV